MRWSWIVQTCLLCAAWVALSLGANAQAPIVPPPSCHNDCHATKTVCVAEPEKKTHTETKYACKCKTICLPNCGALLGGKCGCGEGECGKPREVRRLYKRIVKEERCETTCKPVEVPACTSCVTTCAAPIAKPAMPAATTPVMTPMSVPAGR